MYLGNFQYIEIKQVIPSHKGLSDNKFPEDYQQDNI